MMVYKQTRHNLLHIHSDEIKLMAPRMVTHGQAPIPAFRTDNFDKSLYYKQNNAREITVGTRHALGGLET